MTEKKESITENYLREYYIREYGRFRDLSQTLGQRLERVQGRVLDQALMGFLEIKQLESDATLKERVGEARYNKDMGIALGRLFAAQMVWESLGRPESELREALDNAWKTNLAVETKATELINSRNGLR